MIRVIGKLRETVEDYPLRDASITVTPVHVRGDTGDLFGTPAYGYTDQLGVLVPEMASPRHINFGDADEGITVAEFADTTILAIAVNHASFAEPWLGQIDAPRGSTVDIADASPVMDEADREDIGTFKALHAEVLARHGETTANAATAHSSANSATLSAATADTLATNALHSANTARDAASDAGDSRRAAASSASVATDRASASGSWAQLANTYADNAASHRAAAGTYASQASASATVASGHATDARTARDAAGTHATNASASASAAAASAASVVVVQNATNAQIDAGTEGEGTVISPAGLKHALDPIRDTLAREDRQLCTARAYTGTVPVPVQSFFATIPFAWTVPVGTGATSTGARIAPFDAVVTVAVNFATNQGATGYLDVGVMVNGVMRPHTTIEVNSWFTVNFTEIFKVNAGDEILIAANSPGSITLAGERAHTSMMFERI